MNHETLHRLKERGIDEMRRFLIMFVYLWVVFGLFVLNESLILGQRSISFAPQGFAIVNAAIMLYLLFFLFRDGGTPKDEFAIFRDHGTNLVRLRLWNDPAWTKYGNLADVERSVRMFQQCGARIAGLIENMSYFKCDGCEKKHFLFGSEGGKILSKKFETELLAQLADLVRQQADRRLDDYLQ